MHPNLQFDFLVDREKNTMTVIREFAAPRPLVWDCYTKSELLGQWFAPKPWTARTKKMDFTPGGAWLYAMCGPAGEQHWGMTEYLTIQPIDQYTALDAFCDENGTLNTALPRAKWEVTFTDAGENAVVQTIVQYNSLADLEAILQMGMKEGLTMTLDGLDKLLASLQSR